MQIHRKIQTSPSYINNPAGASEGGCIEVINSIEHSELNVRVKYSELNVHVQCNELNVCIQRSELNVFILVCNWKWNFYIIEINRYMKKLNDIQDTGGSFYNAY